MKIIDEKKIIGILEKTKNASWDNFEKIIEKAKKIKSLDLEEVGVLVNISDEKLIKKMQEAAHEIKMAIYGPRLVLFAPLYISSFCVNDCAYCGFHQRNKAPRKKLSLNEVKKQVEILEDMGHKRLLLEFGEDPEKNSIDYVIDVIKTIYSVKKERGAIRRVNINIAATSVENYKKLKEAGIGTYQLFQETYHRPTYEKLHSGPKADYDRQITAMDRAFAGGIDDLGIGVLFGLYDWRFEVLSLVAHADYMEKNFGVGPHTISVPRFRPAPTVDFKAEHEVSDKDFLKLITILRLAVPYTGMIMSTRESPKIRRRAFEIGISQTSAGSRTTPGGYNQKKEEELAQFNLSDHRTLDETVYDICNLGYLPSFCTACYRSGRTGDEFMKYAKAGTIQNFCQPNAISTFMEYLMDYASPETREVGEKVIRQQMKNINSAEVRTNLENRLEKIRKGERDLYF
ncbi:[FeFe] hydrogenase H-cluster radical SAM maturase HydG [Candidatus Falkowbacteria bacterium RIFOXYB2_FULL_38_15]|uniref:[FeFe] hydrogenase H-cluster radical SAM maturase HydG n=1 Tax=Candidatus Falkowbacteria bacterium RIFOXYA2_FULL_38_12 TaxID=1797993 RepID=A0A1F5S217_9BACT|nr:MAG: [FeFe] hydrogenase H-cluster radical SAM maturase HydG [Candidatus Falkowbacteria bacterium RIFOXYA2_FULL_38_12]OGF32521.1 MAG: [FeFe] hydrogenase H-cluster radical SAM maturase HydG [Candidatus Falkowbacteria bacterium RIFOXYB2_FULL_38_15]OGF42012.1 MAG: [FeFe] hydrogenase H-cluster radical SAM maturase HydG [Candidatus Falkowbacteria bacterium RIFOXYD2_FULL_39_16]